MGLLTLAGFGIQYRHFESKLTDRDSRDTFLRTIDEPLAQVLRDLDGCVATARALKAGPISPELHQALFISLVRTTKEMNRLLVRNSKSRFDSGEGGWISLSTEALDEQIAQLDGQISVEALVGVIDEADKLDRSIKGILDGCRAKAGL